MSKPDAELKYILVTHGHLDHINAIPSLQELFPACRIVTHSLEVPFLTGEIDYRNVKGDTTVYNCCRRLMQVSDVKVRRETINCVDDSNKTFEFENDIKPVRTHGHTPGSMSWLHIPSQSIFVGDAMMNTISFMSPRSAVLQGPYVVSTVSKSDAYKSLEEIRKIEGWQTLYPAHDDGSGIPRKEFENFIEKSLKNQ
ncbi:beta-lactamase-like protein [Paraphysoderma sedebokerense]|nr:beta-lactamase-like protein [Paraphysoderma sedebokerense]